MCEGGGRNCGILQDMYTQCLVDHFSCIIDNSGPILAYSNQFKIQNLVKLLPLICCVEKVGFKPFTSLIKMSRIT